MAEGPDRPNRLSTTQDLESRIFESVQRYEMIFKATNDILYDLDLEKGTIHWNDALFDHYGHARSKQTEQLEWWTSHIHPEDAARLQGTVSDLLLSAHETWENEYRFQKGDGKYIYVRDRGIVQRAPDGMPVRVIGSMLDITQQKKLDRAKDEFVSLVSHQLRTPLTVIRLYSEMLADGFFGEVNDVQKKRLMNINDATLRLINLVGEILDVSKVEMGSFISYPVPTDINALILSYIEGALPEALRKNVKIRFRPNGRIKKVPLDLTIFGQVMRSLLSNAIRFSKPDGGEVGVSIVKKKDSYVISVKDNGIGIGREDKSKVFNRFFRGANTVNINEHGAGLGLYLAKTMAESAGCELRFKSSVGRGSTFYFEIPLDGMMST